MSLATRYRPQRLDQVVGNRSIIRYVQNLRVQEPGRRPHAFLFSGCSGSGKTSLARLVAKTLGCKRGDFHELDSADFRGIDTIREIRRQMTLHPLHGSISFWLMDECHQLTRDAQEAILKALEEPPDHAFFALATTEPEKLKPTLRRRCIHLRVRALDIDDVMERLSLICEREGIKCSKDTLAMIADQSRGSLGVAVAVLDRISSSDEKEHEKVVNEYQVGEERVLNLCQALLKRKTWSEVANILVQLEEEEPESLRQAILGYLYRVLLRSGKERVFLMIDAFKDPLHYTGRAGLAASCFACLKG